MLNSDPGPSSTDADFLGLDFADTDVDASTVLTPRLMSADGSFYGGTGLALACTVIEHATERSTRWCAAQFVHGASLGDRLDLHAELVAHGRRTTQVRVVGRVGETEVFSAFGAAAADEGRITESFTTMPIVTAINECELVDWDFGKGHSESHWAVKEIREDKGVRHAGDVGAPTTALWLRMLPSRAWTPAMLAFVADLVSISIHRELSTRHYGGPSVDNSLRVGPRAETEWVLLALHPSAVNDGFAYGTVNLWAEDGTLLGTACQTLALGSAR